MKAVFFFRELSRDLAIGKMSIVLSAAVQHSSSFHLLVSPSQALAFKTRNSPAATLADTLAIQIFRQKLTFTFAIHDSSWMC